MPWRHTPLSSQNFAAEALLLVNSSNRGGSYHLLGVLSKTPDKKGSNLPLMGAALGNKMTAGGSILNPSGFY